MEVAPEHQVMLDLDFELEPYELEDILANTSFNEINWDYCDLMIKGCEYYDEDGNSSVSSVIVVNAKGRSDKEIDELEKFIHQRVL